MPTNQLLLQGFSPKSYQLVLAPKSTRLTIIGRKIGRPSKRITLHQGGLKIHQAKITYYGKNGKIEVPVTRINHLKKRQEVRLHSANMLFPGDYQLELKYDLSPEKVIELKKLGQKNPNRTLVPSIDEPETWANISFELKP